MALVDDVDDADDADFVDVAVVDAGVAVDESVEAAAVDDPVDDESLRESVR